MDRRFRSMDLLRAIAILLVILAHSVKSYGAPDYLAPLQLGGTGVDLFFVLSGWLLGSLLFKEAERTGAIDIRKFWIRRWLRTLPAYYTVLILTILQRYLTKDNVEFPWHFFFFVQNYDSPLIFFSISWSLCVEEQFYLFIAPLLAFLTSKSNKYVASVVLMTMLLLPVIFRTLGWYGSAEETHVRIDGCVAGVLLAHIHYQHRSFWALLAKNSGYIALAGLVIYFSYYVARYNPAIYWGEPDKLLLAFLFGSWVLLANASEKSRSRLYFPGAYYVATRSYALYLLHPEILALAQRFLLQVPFPLYFLLVLAGSLAISEGLYRVIEKPIMDARERFLFSTSKSKLVPEQVQGSA